MKKYEFSNPVKKHSYKFTEIFDVLSSFETDQITDPTVANTHSCKSTLRLFNTVPEREREASCTRRYTTPAASQYIARPRSNGRRKKKLHASARKVTRCMCKRSKIATIHRVRAGRRGTGWNGVERGGTGGVCEPHHEATSGITMIYERGFKKRAEENGRKACELQRYDDV